MNTYTTEQETLRRYYWSEYFQALRRQDALAARHFQRLARTEEKKKKAAQKFIAEQFELPY